MMTATWMHRNRQYIIKNFIMSENLKHFEPATNVKHDLLQKTYWSPRRLDVQTYSTWQGSLHHKGHKRMMVNILYLLLFLGHLSFQLLFHSIFIFLNLQFHGRFLLIVLFERLYVNMTNPQVQQCFQNLHLQKKDFRKYYNYTLKVIRKAMSCSI